MIVDDQTRGLGEPVVPIVVLEGGEYLLTVVGPVFDQRRIAVLAGDRRGGLLGELDDPTVGIALGRLDDDVGDRRGSRHGHRR